jgi:AhpD family alkylhydroperoxidase
MPLRGVYPYITQSNLPVHLVDQVYLRVSQINGAYCIDKHSRGRLKSGFAVEKAGALECPGQFGLLKARARSPRLASAQLQNSPPRPSLIALACRSYR